MLHIDLFSGIGGFSLACQWNGIETIGFVEIDKYCQKVLKKHWPNVPIVEDIRDVEGIKEIIANAAEPEGSMDRRVIGTSQSGQLRRSNSSGNMGCQQTGEHRSGIGKQSTEPLPTLLITAGFPCQPFSVAGKRQGERDDRYLWPETLAVIKALNAEWILLENVTGIINLALDQVLSDLEGASYSTETLIIPACAINAWHRRDRVWIVAYCNRDSEPTMSLNGKKRQGKLGIIGNTQGTRTRQDNGGVRQRISRVDRGEQAIITNSSINRLERQKPVCEVQQSPSSFGCSSSEWWAVKSQLGVLADGLPSELVGYLENEPNIPRISKGVKDRVNKLKALGNSIYWPVAYEIIRVIKEINDQTA